MNFEARISYVFKLLDSNDRTLVAIYDAILQLEERPSGQPEALKAWFYPGDNFGVEFVYSTQKE